MRLVFWDIDGTLVRSDGAGRRSLRRAFREVWSREANIDAISFGGRTDHWLAGAVLRENGVEPSVENRRLLLERYVTVFPQEMADTTPTLMKGADRAVAAVAEDGRWHQSLLTGNVRPTAYLKVGHFGLAHHFTWGAFCDGHEERDDLARHGLALAKEKLGAQLSGDRIVIIGDTVRDVRCARAIGARVIAVATGADTMEELAKAGPDELIQSLEHAEWPAALRRFE